MKELGRQRKNLKDDLKRLKYKRVAGSLSQGQGYADKRKTAAINKYLRLRKRKGSKKAQFRDQAQDGVSHADIKKDDRPSGADSVGDRDALLPSRESRTEVNPFQSGKKGVPKVSEVSFNSERKLPSKKRSQSSHRFSNAQKLYQEREKKRQQKEQAIQEERTKREKALEDYKKRKTERNKKFSQRTKRGQPIMKHQIDFLLEKIKAQGD